MGADLSSNLGISIHCASVAAWHTRRKLALSLEPDLDKVSGVGDADSNGTFDFEEDCLVNARCEILACT